MFVLRFYKQGAIVFKSEHSEQVYVPIPQIRSLVTVSELIMGFVHRIDYDYSVIGRTEVTVMIGDMP